MLRLPEFTAGGPPPTLDEMRRLVAAARRQMNIDVVPPLFKVGNAVRLDRGGRSFWAKIGGTGGIATPYDLTEQEDDGAGGWIDRPGGLVCTDCAYEANGQSGLAGKFFRVRRGKRTGEWRFVDDRYAPPCVATFQPRIVGCNFFATVPGSESTLAGVVLTLRDHLGNIVELSPGVSTCTTDSRGNGCVWPVTLGETYTLTADPPPLSDGSFPYLSKTVSFTAKCNNNLLRVVLDLQPGFVCCVTCPTTVLPDTLTLDDGLGTITLTYDPTIITPPLCGRSLGTYKVWKGTASRPGLCDSWNLDAYGNCFNEGVKPVGIDFYFYCELSPFLVPPDPIYGLGFGLRQLTCPPFTGSGKGFCHFSTSAGAIVPICDSRRNSDPGVTCDPAYIPFSMGNPDDTVSCITPFNVLGCVYPSNPQPMTVYA